jgi:hypothetical protein
MKKLILFLLLVACSTSKKVNTDTIGDRLMDGEKVVLFNASEDRALHLNPHYDRNLGASTVAIKDLKDPYNVIPLLVLDKIIQDEILSCREPLKDSCLKVFNALIDRLDWPYVLVKEGDSLASIAARECGGSKNSKILRKYNYPYGECIGKADKQDQGLCISLSSGIPIRIPPACN